MTIQELDYAREVINKLKSGVVLPNDVIGEVFKKLTGFDYKPSSCYSCYMGKIRRMNLEEVRKRQALLDAQKNIN